MLLNTCSATNVGGGRLAVMDNLDALRVEMLGSFCHTFVATLDDDGS